jgi:hypothetical protein
VSNTESGGRHAPAQVLRVVLLLCALTSCQSWSASSVNLRAEAAGQTVQVWQHDTAVVINGARWRGDSVGGRLESDWDVLWWAAMPEVDSIRRRRTDVGKTFLTIAGIPFALAALMPLYMPKSE